MKNTKSERAKMRSVLAAQTRWICAIVFVAVSTLSTYGQSGGGGSITSPTGIVMVSIPAGTFTMGSPITEVPDRGDEGDEKQHSVTLTKFYMSKYQVTQEQYQAVMGSNPSNFKSAVAGESGTPGKLPVENVSWYNALVFCNRLSIKEGLSPAYSIDGKTDPAAWGAVPTSKNTTWDAVVIVAGSTGYRLPTEAQWEYACRAGTKTAYNTGNTISNNTGWFDSNSGNKTHEVGKKTANAWGLYDMHGNVWEWCWDWYGYDYYSSSPTNDPTGAVTGAIRVQRGGSYDFYDLRLRSATRGTSSPNNRDRTYGFRLVRP
jgi:formylglycine-generating enzyme